MFLPVYDCKGKAKAPQLNCCEAQSLLLKSSLYIQAETAVGGMPYCFLNAAEKWDWFLNPTSV